MAGILPNLPYLCSKYNWKPIMHFTDLPSHARVWVYQSTTEFTREQHSEILGKAKLFVDSWASHGTALRAGIEVLHKRFVVVAVDEQHAMASGCSIDKSVHFMQTLEQEMGLRLFDRMQVAYRDGEQLSTANMHDFGDLLANGSLSSDTIVFNNLVNTLDDFRNKWEVPVSDSWHARLLPA